MVKKIMKRLSFHRATLDDGTNKSLQELVIEIYEKFPKALNRISDLSLLEQMLLASVAKCPSGDGIYVRLMQFEKGAIAAIDMDTNDGNVILEEFLHPNKRDFLKEEMLLYIIGNKILACNLKNKHSIISHHLRSLAVKADLIRSDGLMQISDVSDLKIVNEINEIGVKYLEFSITSYLANIPLDENSKKILGVLGGLFTSPSSAEHIRKRANTIGRIRLSRGKFDADEIKKDEWLTDLGGSVIESENFEFNIILEDNTEISNNKLRRTKSVKLNRHANSFSYDSGVSELREFYKELMRDGTIGS